MNLNASAWFPQQSAPNPAGGMSGLWNSYNQSQEASRAANANLAQQSLDWWGGIMNQQRSDLNQAAGYLQGTNKANIRDIDKRFSALSGKTSSQLINSGLGNSTIMGSMQTGITNAHADALSRSRADFGTELYNAYSKNAQLNSGLASQQLGFLGNINIGYPNMGAYAQMASMMGQGAGMGGGGGGGYIGDMSRPTGGPQPAWANFGGAGADLGVGGGGWGGMATAPNIPTTSQWAAQQGAALNGGGDSGDGFWASLYPGFQQQRAAASSPANMIWGAAGAVANGAQQGDPYAGFGYQVDQVGQIPAAYAGG